MKARQASEWRGLTLTQPWASAIMWGLKSIETRSWGTSYRGPLIIHAAKIMTDEARSMIEVLSLLYPTNRIFPLGQILGYATLTDVVPVESVVDRISVTEALLGNYSAGRKAWLLENVVVLPAARRIRFTGSLGLWRVPSELRERLKA